MDTLSAICIEEDCNGVCRLAADSHIALKADMAQTVMCLADVGLHRHLFGEVFRGIDAGRSTSSVVRYATVCHA